VTRFPLDATGPGQVRAPDAFRSRNLNQDLLLALADSAYACEGSGGAKRVATLDRCRTASAHVSARLDHVSCDAHCTDIAEAVSLQNIVISVPVTSSYTVTWTELLFRTLMSQFRKV
jgi:hypothetical protein